MGMRNFGAERARKTFEKARRLIQTASDAVSCTPALPKMGWDALGACRVPKLRRNHRKCRDFNRNSRFLNAKFRGKNNRWLQKKLRIVYIVHCTIGRFVLAPRARVGGRARADFQDFARKILHAFNCKLRNFGAERARRTHEKRADSSQTLLMPCHALVRVQECFGRRRARVARQNCADIR